MPDKYGVAQDRYCYTGTEVLKNLLDIRDANTLEEAEADFTAERYRTYKSTKSSSADFTLDHLKYLHFTLFQDLYEWAGKIRDVDISKGNTRFCHCNRIEPEAKKLFNSILSLEHCETREQLIYKVADLFCELNLLHPFREGNGRTLRFFFEELLFILGYEVTWPEMTQEQWVKGNIAGVNLNLSPLIMIFNQSIAKR